MEGSVPLLPLVLLGAQANTSPAQPRAPSLPFSSSSSPLCSSVPLCSCPSLRPCSPGLSDVVCATTVIYVHLVSVSISPTGAQRELHVISRMSHALSLVCASA